MTQKSEAPKLFPRNLTARAAVKIAGNPATTRLEGGVGNCFPGLEFDHRNLDRRFFPGLIFDYGVNPPVLAASDAEDPALADDTLPKARQHSAKVLEALTILGQGEWRLARLEQGGRSIDLQAMAAKRAVDPDSFWRLVRSLTPGQVTIDLARLPVQGQPARRPGRITLTHYRRRYLDADSGAISPAYLPGELTQSLCSPWMHDFRDCACDYWASNHPDIALGADPALSANRPQDADPELAVRPLDWLRADRESRLAADPSEDVNDARRLRHFQINKEWTSLAFVLEGRESDGLFVPRREPSGLPYPDARALAEGLVSLCKLEHVVALEYLYAYYSLRQPRPADGRRNRADIVFVRHELLGIAISEMRHLRWANQLLWTLEKMGNVPRQGPILDAGNEVPTRNGPRPRSLRPLGLDTLDDFIEIERPSGALDGAYARVVATLGTTYPAPMLQLARQIVAEGNDHYNRFRDIAVVLKSWPGAGKPSAEPWLRPITPRPGRSTDAALALYGQILANLEEAYRHGDMEDAERILVARQAMTELNARAEELAAKRIGIPFFPAASAARGPKRRPAPNRAR